MLELGFPTNRKRFVRLERLAISVQYQPRVFCFGALPPPLAPAPPRTIVAGLSFFLLRKVLTPDSWLRTHIPQGYQGQAPALQAFLPQGFTIHAVKILVTP